MNRKDKIRVLVVDDSALVRKILKDGLEQDPSIVVIGTARDPYQARDILVRERPDVITLDVEMPRMDGVTFLKRYMLVYPTPTVMVSSLTEKGKRITIEALEAGAVSVVTKPKTGVSHGLPEMIGEIRERVKEAAQVDVGRFARRERQAPSSLSETAVKALDESTDKVIAIGASTGGTEALARILPAFPRTSPGMVIVQHMPEGFTASFAQRLDSISRIKVKEAADNDRVLTGMCLVAPGGARHMELVRSGGQYRVRLREGEKVSGHRPSVDILFRSVAEHAGRNAAAALLTGMGRDGADGLLAIRRAGGRTIAQNEDTSVVFGMPRAGWENGGAEALVPLEEVPRTLIDMVTERRSRDSPMLRERKEGISMKTPEIIEWQELA